MTTSLSFSPSSWGVEGVVKYLKEGEGKGEEGWWARGVVEGVVPLTSSSSSSSSSSPFEAGNKEGWVNAFYWPQVGVWVGVLVVGGWW